MLAHYLRRLLLLQLALGMGLAYLLTRQAHWPGWAAALLVLTLPVWVTVLATVVSSLMSRNPQESHWMWLRSVLGETLAGIHIFLLRQPWANAPPRFLPATGAHAKVPVVLVHGYLCNHRMWDDTIAALRHAGHPVLAVNLEPVFTSIDNYAQPIEAAVTALCQQTGASRVALVGHSMGGLAIRAWMRACGTRRVAQVLTLGTPHAGTQIAPFTRTPNGLQMRWRSPWTTELLAQESPTTRALMHIALTAQDNIVYPQRQQVLPGAQTTVFEGMGHLQMCLEKPVIDWVLSRLSETRGA